MLLTTQNKQESTDQKQTIEKNKLTPGMKKHAKHKIPQTKPKPAVPSTPVRTAHMCVLTTCLLYTSDAADE